MLLEFKAQNYKSFKEELVFSMIPAPKQTGLNYSVLKEKVGSKQYRGLCSSVIYGPNASGKTNLIGAMDAFKSIVLRGNIYNNEETPTPNTASSNLELIPNIDDREVKPTNFSIKFIDENRIYSYSLVIDLGHFLEEDYSRKIVSETLSVNENMIFSRKETLEFGDLSSINSELVNEFEQYKDGVISIASNNLVVTELFLMNGFKTMFSSKIPSKILSWFERKFTIIYKAGSLKMTKKIPNPNIGTAYIDKSIDDIAKVFGVSSNSLGFIVTSEESDATLCSLFDDSINKRAIPADIFESLGTIRFVNILPTLIRALKTGGTLVIDEFDASIHPMALMSIINIFHNNDLNTENAQLIFNTHNPIFLNSNIFRRDEIKFVERDEVTHLSTHYSLSDFKTSGTTGVRLSDDYLKHYFLGRYGAVKDIDFYDLFENLMNDN